MPQDKSDKERLCICGNKAKNRKNKNGNITQRARCNSCERKGLNAGRNRIKNPNGRCLVDGCNRKAEKTKANRNSNGEIPSYRVRCRKCRHASREATAENGVDLTKNDNQERG